MSAYKINENQIGYPGPASATATVQGWPLGYNARGLDPTLGEAVFVYAQGNNVASAGALVKIINGSAVMAGTVNSASYGFPLGIACGALSATNLYGWVQVEGLCDFARGTNAAVAAGAPVYLQAGAGVIASAVVAGNQIVGMAVPVSYTSSQSASMTVQLNFPTQVGLTASL
jgi:ABC-type Fe3+ transport system substrate-binding protein